MALKSRVTWLVILGGSLVLSVTSLVYRSERLSGTGTHVSRGLPRSYYFAWADNFQSEHAHAGMNWSYFALNWLMWALVVGALVALARLVRHRRADSGPV